jgi:translation initiation factor 1 (eIF-1/SUI1)
MSKPRGPGREPAPPTSLGTLGELLVNREVKSTPRAPTVTPPAPSPPSRDTDVMDLGGCGKVVVRRERKGHAGKTATIIAGLGLAARDLDRLARALRRGLGCGVSVDCDRLVVQGDQTARVQSWLAAHGARRIVLGN